MTIFLFILLGLVLIYLAICLFVFIVKKKRKSSPSPVISICFDGISFLKIGDNRLKVLSLMEKMGLINHDVFGNYLLLGEKDKDGHEYVWSRCGFLEFKEYDCIFYNDSLCGIIMKFNDTRDIGELFEEAKTNVSILNGKYEKTDDGRFIWTQKTPYRLIVLNTTNKTLAVYDRKGMYPNGRNSQA